jgi:oligopeptide/dipeptide ABC transporter ATP-binding protein
MGLAERIAGAGRHPYTRVLWSAQVDRKSAEATRATTARGAWGVFDFERPGSGCRFAPRCPVYEALGRPAICTDEAAEPELRDLGNGHHVACHFPLW